MLNKIIVFSFVLAFFLGVWFIPFIYAAKSQNTGMPCSLEELEYNKFCIYGAPMTFVSYLQRSPGDIVVNWENFVLGIVIIATYFSFLLFSLVFLFFTWQQKEIRQKRIRVIVSVIGIILLIAILFVIPQFFGTKIL